MSVERRKALRKPIAPLSQRVYSVLFHVESTQVIREVVVDADVDLIVITVPRWNLLVQPTIQRASEGDKLFPAASIPDCVPAKEIVRKTPSESCETKVSGVAQSHIFCNSGKYIAETKALGYKAHKRSNASQRSNAGPNSWKSIRDNTTF